MTYSSPKISNSIGIKMYQNEELEAQTSETRIMEMA